MTLRTLHRSRTAWVAALAAGTGAALLATAATGARTAGRATIDLPGPVTIATWSPTASNTKDVKGTVLLDGKPVAGVRVKVDKYVVPAATAKDGTFTYPVDNTMPRRHPVAVVDADSAKVGGKSLSDSDRAALVDGARGSIDVVYGITDLKAAKQKDGTILVTGKAGFADGKTPPPTVMIYTYQLSGTITDSDGKPVAGAVVSTRTLDRSFWTISVASDANGRYTSLFTASAEQPGDPVPFDIRVAKGDDVWEFLAGEQVTFRRLQSATMDIQLPPAGFPIALPTSTSYPGAIYDGLVIGVTAGGQVVDPDEATWTTKDGRFRMVLPASLAGKTVSLWERSAKVFLKAAAKPGAAIEKDVWPAKLPKDASPNVASVTLPK